MVWIILLSTMKVIPHSRLPDLEWYSEFNKLGQPVGALAYVVL